MANLISLLRVLLAMGVVILLGNATQPVYIGAFVLTVVVIWMDGLDGYVARRFNETSKAGAVIDILADRAVEMIYWIAFLHLGWVPLWIPLVIVIRGIWVDGLRSLALEQGYTAFGTNTMMQSKLGVFLVSSRASRWLYAVSKAFTFSLLILQHTPHLVIPFELQWVLLVQTCVYLTVFFCIVRGLPVILEARRFFVVRSTSS